MKRTRRSILEMGWRAGGALLGLAAGWTVYEALRPLSGGPAGGAVPLGTTSNYPVDTATYVPAGRLYVTNVGDQVIALSQKCPHLGCRVPFCESSGRFECGCHGSIFDLAGEWIAGPAPHGMDRYALSVENDVLTADTQTTIAGPDRGADTYATPPKGPSCL